ncbi:hypothetical protein HUU05_17500, partial [candidate division KSB1 bacterium]|nr:hypothetical protein [candidate division KSB1 bacterium]
MKSPKFCIAFFIAASLLCGESLAQSPRWYFGSALGAQQWLGPLNANVGLGGEATVGRAFSQRTALAFVAGFASMPFQQSTLNNGVKFILVPREANLFYGNFLFDIHPFGHRQIVPYFRFGGGLLNVQVGSQPRKNYAATVLGAGLQLQVNRDLAINLTGNYHYLAGQVLAGFESNKSPSGYFATRLGLTFSTSSGEGAEADDWVTTLDSELSPFKEAPEAGTNAAAAAQENSTPAEAQDEETVFVPDDDSGEDDGQNADNNSAADDEAALVADDDSAEYDEQFGDEPAEISFKPVAEESQPLAEKVAPNAEHAAENEAALEDDPFARFSRKVDSLEQENEAKPPAPPYAEESPLGDEPKFEEFYPYAKSDKMESFKENLLREKPAEESTEAEVEETPQVAAFKARLDKLDEHEDFLSPATEITDAPVQSEFPVEEEKRAEISEVEPASAQPAPLLSERAPEIDEAPVQQSQPDFSAFETRMQDLDRRSEQVVEAESRMPDLQEPSLAQSENTAPQASAQPYEPPFVPEKAKTSTPTYAAQNGKHVEEAPALRKKKSTPRARPRVSASPQTSAPPEVEDEELRELRARLDELEGGASWLGSEHGSVSGYVRYSDEEAEELHRLLDKITGEHTDEQRAPRYAENLTDAAGEIDETKSPEAIEAFKDRLGLSDDQQQTAAEVEWDQQKLKSQITNLDEELERSEEDLSAIRTALAQSATNGAAFPTRPVVTRGSFAQGYEGALNSFYMQR